MVSQQLEVRPPRLSPARVARTFNENIDAVDRRLRSFLEVGDAAAIHSLRGSMRRLEASYALVPKRYRPKQARRYVHAARKVRRETNSLRDSDVILAALSSITDTREYGPLIRSLQNSRARSLKPVLRDARAFADMKRPQLTEDDLRGATLQKRLASDIRRLRERVNRELAKFLKTHETETMHDLRKDSRRLRYALELSGGEDNDHTSKRLREIQNSLGAVRDDDLVIEYVRNAKPAGKSRLFFREKTAERHAKIEDFVTKQRSQGPLMDL